MINDNTENANNRPNLTNLTDSNNNSRHVMISYCRENQSHCDKLYSALLKHFHLWRDVNNLNGAVNLWAEIAAAVNSAEVIIAVITPEYEKSMSCDCEFNFAINNNKIIIPIIIDRNHRPSGGIGIRMANLIFFLYDNLMAGIDEFVKHILLTYKRVYNTEMSSYKGKLNTQPVFLKRESTTNKTSTNNLSLMNKDEAKTSLDRYTVDRRSPCPSFQPFVEILPTLENDVEITDKSSDLNSQCIVDKNDKIHTTTANTAKILDIVYNERENNDTFIKGVYELHLNLDLVHDTIVCFSMIDESDMIVGSENGDFYLIMYLSNVNIKDYVKLKLKVVGRLKDPGLYKVVDMCVDENENKSKKIIVLYCAEKRGIKEFFIDFYALEADLTIRFLNDMKIVKKNENNVAISGGIHDGYCTTQKCICNNFTRIGLNYNKTLILLMDETNDKIYWYKKTNGAKVRCVRSVNNSIRNPTAIIDLNQETIICSKSGLLSFGQDFTYLHEKLNTIIDIVYDDLCNKLLFIDMNAIYYCDIGRDKVLRANKLLENMENIEIYNIPDVIDNYKMENMPSHSGIRVYCSGSLECSLNPAINDTINLNYNSFIINKKHKRVFKRILATKEYIFVLTKDPETTNSHSALIAVHRNHLSKLK